ncbi:MAG: bifunctional diaminohydroxyphosphoribosylaminopyrimidine deaminase/5-amino-6-(5-phosphoribosylamino)uracil reductase RibD [Bacteroidota bacterium]
MNIHEQYMQRCLQLALKGLGKVSPNPMVGCVIVHDNKIIGEGYHEQVGEAHAEVNAINSVEDKTLLKTSTLYVSLEPCNHFGKTPPCSDLILKHQIPNVFIGVQDPFEKVNGSGIQKLKDAGVNVIVGILEEECREINKRFFTFHIEKRPYLILKWAQSKDGFIGKRNQSVRISNELSRIINDTWRTQEDAILIGGETARTDNPHLTVRTLEGRNPTRIILSNSGNLSDELNVLDGNATTFIYSSTQISKPNCETILLPKNNDLTFLLADLYQRNIQSVIIEGGASILNQFLKNELWDEIRLFESDNKLEDGILAPFIPQNADTIEPIDNNQLKIFYRRK